MKSYFSGLTISAFIKQYKVTFFSGTIPHFSHITCRVEYSRFSLALRYREAQNILSVWRIVLCRLIYKFLDFLVFDTDEHITLYLPICYLGQYISVCFNWFSICFSGFDWHYKFIFSEKFFLWKLSLIGFQNSSSQVFPNQN